MPFTPKDLYELPISFCNSKGETWVIVSPNSKAPWFEKRIPLDGREYICAGTIFLKNGTELRASFSITTTTFDFIKMDTVYIPVNETWYRWDEPELLIALGINEVDFVPYKWKSDKPLDYSEKGPYLINERLLKH